METSTHFWSRLSPRQQSILIGTGVTAALSSSYIGIGYCCCVGVIIGGMLAAQQYATRTKKVIDTGDGVLVGALSGLFGAVVVSVVELVMRLVGIGVGGVAEQAMELLPRSTDVSREVARWQGQGELLWFVGELIGRTLLYPLLGTIGGALGVAIFGDE